MPPKKNGKVKQGFLVLFLSLTVTGALAVESEMQSKPASAATLAAQAAMLATLPQDDSRDDEFVHRGYIADAKDPIIRDKDGHIVWNVNQSDWIKGEAPKTVNPSLWRQMKLLGVHGLFKVAEGVYQVRGFDYANMAIVEGKTGWIIIDTGMTVETAKAAIDLVNDTLGKRPVTGVIYSHSHVDHFGGVRGVVDTAALPPIIAPDRLVEEITSESVIAGNAMARRAALYSGVEVPLGERGFVGNGLTTGPGLTSAPTGGTVSLIPPSDQIKATGETRVIDGVKFEFQMVPQSEAPSEMNLFLPQQRTLFIAETATCSLHNILTPRGAQVRDALKWAGYLTEALSLYGDRADALMTGHCWPRFGNEAIKKYLGLQRDNYKYLHDQTVRMFNSGETPTEIAEALKQPAAIANEWSNRGYYGSVRHNVKAIYQRYLGWWDSNPAHLNLYPPVEQGKRYVKAMGGAAGVIREAKRAMAEGDYRWSAEILNHVVFADPNNRAARALLADSYEQMGYQAENAAWRTIYLTGAGELRGTVKPSHVEVAGPDIVAAISVGSFLDVLGTRMNPDKIGDRAMTMVLDVTDEGGKSLVSVHNSVLVGEVGKSTPQPSVTVSGTKAQLMALFLGSTTLEKMETQGVKVSGDRTALLALQKAIEAFPRNFPIVTP